MRYGGDEFLIILADTTAAGAENVVRRIRGNFDSWNDEGHLEGWRMTVSIGIAKWYDGLSLDEVFDRADRKSTSGSRVANPWIRLSIEHSLRYQTLQPAVFFAQLPKFPQLPHSQAVLALAEAL